MRSLQYNNKYLDLSVSQIMVVINVNDDSFYSASRFKLQDDLFAFIDNAIDSGVSILDIGAVSSRPYAQEVSETDEIDRILEVIPVVRERYNEIFISVDTFRSTVARIAIDEGVDMINDIYAGKYDDGMVELISDNNIPYVMMHMQGSPQTMQNKPEYQNVSLEVLNFLAERKHTFQQAGAYQLILDPGFGFGKSVEQNYELLKKLEVLSVLELPILAGLSRKSMIYKPLEIDADQSLNGTTALNLIALQNGASILRVHDAKEAKEVVTLHKLLS